MVDLHASTTIDAATQYSGAEFTPWQGWQVPVRIVHTLVRGAFAVRDGELVGNGGNGRYLNRPRSGATALAAAEHPDLG